MYAPRYRWDVAEEYPFGSDSYLPDTSSDGFPGAGYGPSVGVDSSQRDGARVSVIDLGRPVSAYRFVLGPDMAKLSISLRYL